MDASDEVQDHERIHRAEPQRGNSRHPAAPCEAGQRPDDQANPEQCHESMQEDRRGDVVAGDLGDALTDPDEERAIGRGGVTPEVGDRPGEDVVDAESADGAHRVRIHAAFGDGALCQVGVDVLAEQGRSNEDRGDPEQQRAVGLPAGHTSLWASTFEDLHAEPADREASDHQPGDDEHQRSADRHRQRRAPHSGWQRQEAQACDGVLQHWDLAGTQGTDQQQHRTGGSEDLDPEESSIFFRVERADFLLGLVQCRHRPAVAAGCIGIGVGSSRRLQPEVRRSTMQDTGFRHETTVMVAASWSSDAAPEHRAGYPLGHPCWKPGSNYVTLAL